MCSIGMGSARTKYEPRLRLMSQVAFLFPGQGSQYRGMGKAIAREFPEARRTFEEADDAIEFSLSQVCFEGSEEELKKTENTQPALLAVSTAAYRVLESHGFKPGVVAGHSLGEYSALVAAGTIAFTDAVRLVRKRGQFMQEAVPDGAGAMAALLKLPPGELDRVLANAAQNEIVTAANLNSPDQVVIAGHTAAVERAMELAKAAGAKRAIRLAVSAPFHCPLMLPAQERLRPELDALSFADPKFPVVNNWQAKRVTTGAEARQGLYEQIPNPVRWNETILEIAQFGIKRFVEVGAGAVLLGLVRHTNKAFEGAKFGEPADLEIVSSYFG
jgi:[acyl-carrier-protein] S-malonyltransferase